MSSWLKQYHSTASYILPNGGLAGMVWMYLVSLFGFSFAILSMAEMSSMYVSMRWVFITMTLTG